MTASGAREPPSRFASPWRLGRRAAHFPGTWRIVGRTGPEASPRGCRLRPGTPGYAEFVSHGQPPPNPEAAGDAQHPAADQTAQIVSQKPVAEVQRTSIFFGGPQIAAPRQSVPPNSQPSLQSPPVSGGASGDGSVPSRRTLLAARHATPARSRSWKFTIPTGASNSTTISACFFSELRTCSASPAN